MENKKLKKLMTDVAKGKISNKEVDNIINQEKMQPESHVREFKGKNKDNTHKRKKVSKLREVK